MRLFISNFSGIAKILGIFFVLFALYTLFLIVAKPSITSGQNQWQNNHILAQNYIYMPPPQHIVVGSSMAARLDSEILEKSNIYNLAFAGGSALTGLMIIKENALLGGYVPKSIWIEENILLMRGADSDMFSSLFHPVGYVLKKHIPSLREQYQPLNFVMSALKARFGKNVKISQQRDERIYQSSLQNQLAQHQAPIQNYETNLALLDELLAFFEQRGVQIIFFQMPFDPLLASTPKIESQHDILRQHFPQHIFLPPPNHQAYITNDGIHLMLESATRFSEEFINAFGSMQQDKK